MQQRHNLQRPSLPSQPPSRPHTHKATQPHAPGVSMMVRLGQYLYSMRTTISLAQNCASRSSRAFSFSMYSCAHVVGGGGAGGTVQGA